MAKWQHVPWIRIYRGLDLGFWPDPAYCLWVAVVGRQLIPFKEKTWFRTIAKDMARDIIAESQGMSVVTTYCDPQITVQRQQEETIRDILEKEGMAVDAAVNDRVLYAHSINSLLKEEVAPGVPRLQIYEAGCPYLVKSLPQMRYDEKDPMKMADHKHDHPAITLAYIAMNIVGATSPQTTTATLPKWMQRDSKQGSRLGRHNVRGR
jgi:hypothetical protein